MWLRVEFTAPTAVVVAWNYPDQLYGMLMEAILQVRSSLSELLHGEGFSYKGHQYRLLTASWLFPKRSQPVVGGSLFEPPIRR